jgi:hypothetical protein
MVQSKRCLLVAASLVVALLPCCGDTDSCVQVPCVSGAWLHIPLGASGASLSGTTVSVCRNVECYAAALPAVPSPDSAGASLVFSVTPDVVGTLWQKADQSLVLEVEWHLGSVSQAVDGDRYLVTLVDATGRTTPLLDQVATYQATTPDPRQCPGAAPCVIADLSP